MSVIGRGTKSIRKQDVAEQKSVSLSFKKIVFAHKANAGETGINVTSLSAPSEMTSNGFANPAVSTITRVNIYQHRNNVKIVSSLSGLLMPYLSYTINSSTYIAFNGFTAAQDEIFTVYLDEVPTTSLSVVDGDPIIASGTLLAGQTDFNIGMPIEINKYPSQQIGAVMVYVDRGLQYRKVGNVTGGDGDYIEVPVAGGLGSLIRFDASLVDRFVTVVSNGVVAERPDGSMTAMIENVQGQIDQIVPTVAALAGVPETNFQISPNSVDLKQFGDSVIDLQSDVLGLQSNIQNHESRISVLEALPQPIVGTSTGAYTPSISAVWYALPNNSITLPTAGTWCVSMAVQARNNGVAPNYTRVHAELGNSNGANTTTQPGISYTGNWANVITTSGAIDMVRDGTGNDTDMGVYNALFTTSGPITIFGNTYAQMTTPANARIYVSIWAWKMR